MAKNVYFSIQDSPNTYVYSNTQSSWTPFICIEAKNTKENNFSISVCLDVFSKWKLNIYVYFLIKLWLPNSEYSVLVYTCENWYKFYLHPV